MQKRRKTASPHSRPVKTNFRRDNVAADPGDYRDRHTAKRGTDRLKRQL
jgi:hypothetical protein